MSSEEIKQIKLPKGRPKKPDDEKIIDMKAYKREYYLKHYKQNHPLPRGNPVKSPEAHLFSIDAKLYHRERRNRIKMQQLENNYLNN